MPEPPRRATVRCPLCGRRNRVDLARLAQGPKCADCERPLRLDRPLTTTSEDLEDTVATAEVPVLVDFHADWCGPCKVMAPLLDEVARAREGWLVVLKLDTDRHPAASTRHGIRGIPTLIAFREGRESGRVVGAVPPAEVDRLLDG